MYDTRESCSLSCAMTKTEKASDNLFGTMMSNTTRQALLARRPGLRPLIITRSTFAGAGNYTGKWLGDNSATWDNYRKSIAGILAMTSVYQIPMVGSDICGFSKFPSCNVSSRLTSVQWETQRSNCALDGRT